MCAFWYFTRYHTCQTAPTSAHGHALGCVLLKSHLLTALVHHWTLNIEHCLRLVLWLVPQQPFVLLSGLGWCVWCVWLSDAYDIVLRYAVLNLVLVQYTRRHDVNRQHCISRQAWKVPGFTNSTSHSLTPSRLFCIPRFGHDWRRSCM